MKKIVLPFIIATMVLCTAMHTQAQVKKPVAKPVQAAKTLAPKLKTYLGNLPGGRINLDGALTLLDKPLLVKDEKGNDWTITHMRFSWRAKDFFDDPETGEKKSHINTLAKEFSTGSLTPTVIESVKLEIKPGDELYYEMITVKGKDGNKYLAPSIRFTIQ
jgi:hypothetical protein